MFRDHQASIAIFGFRTPPAAGFADIVSSIDALLQNTDAEPRQINWVDPHIAFIDRVGMRIALGYLPSTDQDRYCHLILAVGQRDDPLADEMLTQSSVHLADKLVQRIKEDMPYDTVMRGETPEELTKDLIEALFDLVRKTSPAALSEDTRANVDAGPDHIIYPGHAPDPALHVIHSDEIGARPSAVENWFNRRALPSKPLRLTIHTVGLSVMLFTPPLGAFLFTYSMLRDMAGPA